jgi:hypothetical protein
MDTTDDDLGEIFISKLVLFLLYLHLHVIHLLVLLYMQTWIYTSGVCYLWYSIVTMLNWK